MRGSWKGLQIHPVLLGVPYTEEGAAGFRPGHQRLSLTPEGTNGINALPFLRGSITNLWSGMI